MSMAVKLIENALVKAHRGHDRNADCPKAKAGFALVIWDLEKALSTVRNYESQITRLVDDGIIDMCQSCGDYFDGEYITDGRCKECSADASCWACCGTGCRGVDGESGAGTVSCDVCKGRGAA